MASNSPEKTFRIGLVSASIFANEAEGGKRTILNVNLQRRYRDGDSWKSSTSFGLADIPVALRVLQLAQGYVEEREAEVSS
ncbi:hypothetical protein KOR42_34250 [Thalassoglobus neptunius]|uniref:Uncharacterized protein n=1 Tax=Thalassoglobus neptunius TaxID=1938619 RepID=A0A5C5WM48_9PLAN|nr:hypothetical protein [Thalassoglobus neptunius]TWT51738.1 hypothetical protein KOR42_34250 [Thalassoglobus neptunius]